MAFARLAEIIRDYAKKGMLLYIGGKLETQKWEDKQTQTTRYRTQIVAARIQFLSPNSNNSSKEDTVGGSDCEPTYSTDDDFPF